MNTVIVVPDFTRKAHLRKLLPYLIRSLEKEGISLAEIEIIIATGLHRPPSPEEIKEKLGTLIDKIKISVHDYRKKSVAYFGKTKYGIPIFLNKKLKSAQHIITLGVVEPHLYAGYSGGTKVIAIGLAGEQTINITHHPVFLEQPGVGLCSVRQNPFMRFIKETSRLLPIKYSVNIINDKNGNILKIFQGHPETSFRNAVSYAEKIFKKTINKSYEVIICHVPKEKGMNIYQASRAFNYVTDTRKNILKHKSLILIEAGLERDTTQGLAERRFMEKIIKIKEPEKFIENIKKENCPGGEHRAYMVARAMLKARLGFISKKAYLYKNRSLPFLFFKSPYEAYEFIEKYFKKKPYIFHVKNAFQTIFTKKF